MNSTLRNKLVAAIAGGSGAITIAAVMLGNADGLEGRRYYAYQDVVGVWTVCDGHTGSDIRRGHRYTDKECDALLQSDLRKVAAAIDPLIKVRMASYLKSYQLALLQIRLVALALVHG